MSKPLTIDELKALQVGDWVWIVYLPTCIGNYDYVEEHGEDSILMHDFGNKFAYKYSDYGYMWLAYKNREQAIGEDYEVRCKALHNAVIGFCYDFDNKAYRDQFYDMTVGRRVRHIEKQAEAQLKKLRGEK